MNKNEIENFINILNKELSKYNCIIQKEPVCIDLFSDLSLNDLYEEYFEEE